MAGIDGIGRLAQLIERRIASQQAGTSQHIGKPSTPSTSKTEPRFFTQLVDRVATLDPADPDKTRKAFRYFLEAALISDLGETLVNDPGFHDLVDSVQSRMEALPEVKDAAMHAATLLLKMRKVP